MKPGRDPRGELAEPRGGRLARAEVELGGLGDAARRAAAAASRATSAASRIWPIESRNFAATSRVSSVPDACAHAVARSAKLGGGGLDEQERAVAERERGVAVRRADDDALAAALDRAQHPRAVGRLEVLHPLEDDRALLQRGDQRGLGHHLGAVEVADVGDDERAAVGLGDERLGVRAGEDDRERARVAEHPRQRLDRLVAAGVVARVRRPCAAGRPRAGRPCRRRAGARRAGR